MITLERAPFASIVLDGGAVVSVGDIVEFADDATGEIVSGQVDKITGKKTTKIFLNNPQQTCQEIWYLDDISGLVVTKTFADLTKLG